MTSAGTTRRLALLGIVLALTLPAVFMACGGDEPDAGGERAAPTTQTEAASTRLTEAATAAAPLVTIERGSVEEDREALIAIYNAADGENWTASENWLTDAPLGQWNRVTANHNGRVVLLGLHRNQLTGEIPPELGSLANLDTLYLSNNQLTGEIPPELGSLANLRMLHLNNNQLSGEIPPELGSLANLEHLDLSDNDLGGEIPPELGSLANLKTLDLSDNELSGEIPAELGSLANLYKLYLGGNELSGCVPSSLQGQLDLDQSDLGDLPFCP